LNGGNDVEPEQVILQRTSFKPRVLLLSSGARARHDAITLRRDLVLTRWLSIEIGVALDLCRSLRQPLRKVGAGSGPNTASIAMPRRRS
jgi:hypothetical protein